MIIFNLVLLISVFERLKSLSVLSVRKCWVLTVKLKAHFEKVHPTYQDKDTSFFHGLERSLKAAKLDLFQQQNELSLIPS